MRTAPRQVTINSRSYAASCGRCGALMLPNATVCRSCRGFAVDHSRRPDYDRPVVFEEPIVPAAVQFAFDASPAYARPNPERLSTVLSCWPFGAADPSDGQAITYFTETTLPAPRLEPVTQRSDVPSQRVEMQSVRSVGPNPFLSATRMLHAREEAQAS
jgi:hypothetical protein